MRLLQHRDYLVKIEYLATTVVEKIFTARGDKKNKKINVVAGAGVSNEDVLKYLDDHWYEFSDEESKPALHKTTIVTENPDPTPFGCHNYKGKVAHVESFAIEEVVKNHRSASRILEKFSCCLCGRSYYNGHVFMVEGLKKLVCTYCVGAIRCSKGWGKELSVNFEGDRRKH